MSIGDNSISSIVGDSTESVNASTGGYNPALTVQFEESVQLARQNMQSRRHYAFQGQTTTDAAPGVKKSAAQIKVAQTGPLSSVPQVEPNDPASAPPAQTDFSQVADTFRTTDDQSRRDTVLNAGVDTARQRARQLFRDTGLGKGPVADIRARHAREAGIDPKSLPGNPFLGVTQQQFEQAYRSWASSGGTGTPPWVRLAVAVKEGWTSNRDPGTYESATTADQARTLWRSRFYFGYMGLDHFIYHDPQPTGDNLATFGDADAVAHQATFESRANAIAPGLAGQIDAEIEVTPRPGGGFDVRPTSRFYELSLRLTDGYFSESVNRVEGHDLGLGYIRWNMGEDRYANFEASALQHSHEDKNRKPNGDFPTQAEWAFKTPILPGEYNQPRRNALRFLYSAEVYRLAFEGIR